MTHSLLDSMLPKTHTFNTVEWFKVKDNGFHIIYCMHVELKHESNAVFVMPSTVSILKVVVL